MLAGSFVVCTALLAACGSNDGPEGTVVPLDFCTAPDWVAIKDGSGPWQHILPVEGAYEATFETAKGGLAWASGPGGSLAGVIVQYGLPSELAVHCSEGTAQVNGSVTAIAETEHIQVGLANSNAFLHGTNPQTSFSLRSVPAGTWTLFGARLNDLPEPPIKVIVRRGVAVPHTGDLDPLDFDGPEAFTLAAAQATITGLGASTVAILYSSYFDSDGWQHEYTQAVVSLTGPTPFVAFPLERLETGELSEVTVLADDNLGYRGVYQFFRAPTDLTVAMGPVLNRPAVTFPNTSPYLRPLAQLASQVDYGQGAEAQFFQTSHYASIAVSAAYLGGTPATWQLELPDFSGVDGWDNAWGLDPAGPTQWSVRAQAGAVPYVRAQLHEGDRFLYAAQVSEQASIKASLDNMRPPNP
jgi:hypothetical protein